MNNGARYPVSLRYFHDLNGMKQAPFLPANEVLSTLSSGGVIRA